MVGETTGDNGVRVVVEAPETVDVLVVGFRRDGEFYELARRRPPCTMELTGRPDTEDS